jgi:beta-N-acetylhexosaminidase
MKGLAALDAAQSAWVARTRAALSLDEKISQLFNFAARAAEPRELEAILALRPGAFTVFPGADAAATRELTERLVDASAVPPLISGDIEGGSISHGFATAFPNQLGIAACDDPALTAAVAAAMALESRSVGFNWAFAPVVDVNAAFRSTIVGTRSYGADPVRVLTHARACIRALQDAGVAATAKHWPGEGYDDRDQHLLTTVNRLPMQRWQEVFGTIYRSLIDDGLFTIMAGHIALPAWHGHDAASAYEPASLSRRINVDLLRGELGFAGLLVSDATVMAGMASRMPRAHAVPAVIENGCDMFLFSRDARADHAFMKAGLHSGRLSESRLEEAVTRVLELKARLNLHLPRDAAKPATDLAVLRSPETLAFAARVAARSLTLVKDTQQLLPLDLQRHRRITVFTEPGSGTFIEGAPRRSFLPLQTRLRSRGFVLRAHDPDDPPTPQNTDLLLYLVGEESTPVIASGQVDWVGLHGSPRKAMLRHWPELPGVMISFGHPYLLYGAPDVPTYINAYCAIAAVQEALVDALLGAAGAFAGVSPVDAFCGCPELRF